MKQSDLKAFYEPMKKLALTCKANKKGDEDENLIDIYDDESGYI